MMGCGLTTTTWTAALTPCMTQITTEAAMGCFPGDGLRLHARTLRKTSLMKQLATITG